MTTGIGGEGMGQTLQSSRFEQKHEVSVLDWSYHVLRFKSQVKVYFSLEWVRIKLVMLHLLPGILESRFIQLCDLLCLRGMERECI